MFSIRDAIFVKLQWASWPAAIQSAAKLSSRELLSPSSQSYPLHRRRWYHQQLRQPISHHFILCPLIVCNKHIGICKSYQSELLSLLKYTSCETFLSLKAQLRQLPCKYFCFTKAKADQPMPCSTMTSLDQHIQDYFMLFINLHQLLLLKCQR